MYIKTYQLTKKPAFGLPGSHPIIPTRYPPRATLLIQMLPKSATAAIMTPSGVVATSDHIGREVTYILSTFLEQTSVDYWSKFVNLFQNQRPIVLNVMKHKHEPDVGENPVPDLNKLLYLFCIPHSCLGIYTVDPPLQNV